MTGWVRSNNIFKKISKNHEFSIRGWNCFMYVHTPINSTKDDDDPYRKKIRKSPEKKMTINWTVEDLDTFTEFEKHTKIH